MAARPVVGREPNLPTRARRKDASVQAILNSLVRKGEVDRDVGKNTWKINPAFLAGTFQPLDSDLTAIAALATTTFGRSLLTLADLAAAQTSLKIPVVLFDHFTDAGNGTTVETDLYSDTLAAGRLAANGEKIEAQYAGVFVSSATATRQVRIYFGGTVVFDSGALTLSLSSAWDVYVEVIRVSSSVVRVSVSLTTQGAALAAYTSYTEVTGLTLANTQVLKITGQAAGVGAATNDIVAKLGNVKFFPAA